MDCHMASVGTSWGRDVLRVTVELGDAAQLRKFIAALGAAVQVLLLGRSQRLVSGECAVGQPIGIQMGHDVTPASRVRRWSKARRAWLLTVPIGRSSCSAICG